MIQGANAYLSSFSDKFMDVPWGAPCARLEGGAYTNRNGDPNASCEVGIPPGVLYIVNRDYLIDEEKGVINVFCRFGDSKSGMPDSHSFRFVDGRIRGPRDVEVRDGAAEAEAGRIHDVGCKHMLRFQHGGLGPGVVELLAEGKRSLAVTVAGVEVVAEEQRVA